MDRYLAKIESGVKFEINLTAPRRVGDFPMQFRSVNVKGKDVVQIAERKGAQMFHQNLSLNEAVKILLKSLPSYKRIQMIFSEETVEWVANRKGEWVQQGKNKQGKSLQIVHNRVKQHPFPEGTPVSFLIHLGVMKPDGKVVPAKYDKFRQINRFVELVEDVVKQLPKTKKLTIIDFGCGKAYLTFALYYWLKVHCHRDIEIIGLDLKESVVEFCEKTARELEFEHLHFRLGKIEEMIVNGHVDMVVTLHACDTATDAALAKAIEWNASVILSVPCCQHELLSQIQCKELAPLLKHGLLKERFSALVTDAARAEQLEIAGYDVDIAEFVDPEHTPKNLMIRAIKRKEKGSRDAYDTFKKFLSIDYELQNYLTIR